MWYVISESGDLQSTASHEGSCDTTEAVSAAGGKGVEDIASELVTMAIQNAVIRLQNEVKKQFISRVKLLEYSFTRLVKVMTWSQLFPRRLRKYQATYLW